ncbi:MAG: hypothetical protein JW850_18445 [Thermoflexales bacterium]|nr:hypothetical protein [Thermoflexales bacterium]
MDSKLSGIVRVGVQVLARVGFLGVLVLLILGRGSTGAAPGPVYYSEGDRFGVNVAQGDIREYDLAALGAGWYLNWRVSANPPHPDGVEFVQTVRTCHGLGVPTPETVAQAVVANPGALWLIGNEPDSPWNDNCLPEEYAQAYHAAYTLIKSLDPTAQVAAGGIVQATPLRLEYLDQVLAAYQQAYGQPLPADAWQIHGFVLREEYGGWGASIPPGLAASTGMLYNIRDVDNMDCFRQQIVRFRQWMKAHGWQNLPLHVTEYGVLMWEDIVDDADRFPPACGAEPGQIVMRESTLDVADSPRPFDSARVQAFMTATFDYFLYQAIDPALGCPADGSRLVQIWSWYSLRDDMYNEQGMLISSAFNGDLFDCLGTCSLNPLGQAYAAYVLPRTTPYVDLWPQSLGVNVGQASLGETGPLTLTAQVANRGNASSPAGWSLRFAGAQGEIGTAWLGAVPLRYQGTANAEMGWMAPVSGTHAITLVVEAGEDVDPSNNTGLFTLSLTGDALPSSLAFDPPVLWWTGDSLTATARVRVTNPGSVAVRDVRVQFLREGLPLGDVLYVERLPAGGEVVHTATWTETAPGTRRMAARAWSPATGQKSLSANFLVARFRLFLPAAAKKR